ncbi:hypothetical protein EXN66_Car016537 [Channa argus]|uniref:Uncharacterized protein n=1 Tax=Channa argus TaxID=215402 RepID=A0A6G1QEM3_CHAAH|nr:hypothetical protein EXN66_Car016537 [Channa argus]
MVKVTAKKKAMRKQVEKSQTKTTAFLKIFHEANPFWKLRKFLTFFEAVP